MFTPIYFTNPIDRTLYRGTLYNYYKTQSNVLFKLQTGSLSHKSLHYRKENTLQRYNGHHYGTL